MNKDENEICGGCLIKSICKTTDTKECVSPHLRRKAVLLMFIIPLVIMAVLSFALVLWCGWSELMSFGVIVITLILYYVIIHIVHKQKNI